MMWIRVVVLLALEMVLSCRGPSTGKPDSRVDPSPADVDRALLQTLSILATGAELTPGQLRNWSRRIGARAGRLDAYVDALVQEEGFARRIAPQLLLGHVISTASANSVSTYVLQKAVVQGREIHYLLKPCRLEETVQVRPWWAPESEVLVCSHDYRPDVFDNEPFSSGAQALPCSSGALTTLFPKRLTCGCGASLFRCFPDPDRQLEMDRSVRREAVDTVTWLTEHDAPIERYFTETSSFRDRNVELNDRFEIIEARRMVDVASYLDGIGSWPKEGRWAPRVGVAVGQEAGLLTTRYVAQSVSDRRQRQGLYYDLLWCAEPAAVGATADAVLSLQHATNLQVGNEGWKELAARPLCTDCHARLDYGFQFFLGYEHSALATHYEPRFAGTGRGPLFGRNIDDPRGEADLTPQGFAALATAQPEFRDCMSRRVADAVFGNRGRLAVRRSLASLIAAGPTSLRTLMRTALLEYASAWGSVEPSPSFPPWLPGSDDDIGLSSRGKALIEEHCSACHYAGGQRPLGPPMSRELGIGALHQVAFGKMPAGGHLAEAPRREIVAELIAALWRPDDVRREVFEYFGERWRGMPAVYVDLARQLVRSRAGGATETAETADASWSLYEWSTPNDTAQVTPGLVGVLGVEAVLECRKQATSAALLERCLTRTLSIDMVIH